MPQFHETRMGVRFYEAELPRITKALEGIAESLAKLAAAQPTKTFQPVCEKCGGNATDGYKVGEWQVCEACFHGLAGLVPVEQKVGANVCCDDPDCPDKDGTVAAQARCEAHPDGALCPVCLPGTFRKLAKQLQRDGELELDDDARVSISRDDAGNVQGAYVQAWVWVDAAGDSAEG